MTVAFMFWSCWWCDGIGNVVMVVTLLLVVVLNLLVDVLILVLM